MQGVSDMFTLTASMMTGVPQIDSEHRTLVEIINALAEAERHLRSDDVIAALGHFQRELESHFQREEAYLRSIRFPGQAAHEAHHAETLSRLEEVKNDAAAQPGAGGVAITCFDELLRAVLKQDLEVVNWEADRKLHKK